MEIRLDPEGIERLFVDAPELYAEFEVWGTCPVQALGTVLGRELFFRARGEHWSFDVADDDGNLPSDGACGPNGLYLEGKHRNAGYMEHAEAVRIIERCLRVFTGEPEFNKWCEERQQ